MIRLGNFNVVIDACTLYKACVRDLLLRLAEAEMYQPKWSESILEEVTRNLIENRGITEQQATHLTTQLTKSFPEANVENYEDIIPSLTINEKDKHVLAVAIKSNAQVIVTDNIKDFPTSELEKYDIEAQIADDFLLNLFDLAPITIIKTFKNLQKSLRKPSITIEELLIIFEKQVPNFTQQITTGLQELENQMKTMLSYNSTD